REASVNGYSFATQLFRLVLETSAAATVLFGIVLLVRICLPRILSPSWRYALLLLIVVRLLVPVAPASKVSIFNLWHRMERPEPSIDPLPSRAAEQLR